MKRQRPREREGWGGWGMGGARSPDLELHI